MIQLANKTIRITPFVSFNIRNILLTCMLNTYYLQVNLTSPFIVQHICLIFILILVCSNSWSIYVWRPYKYTISIVCIITKIGFQLLAGFNGTPNEATQQVKNHTCSAFFRNVQHHTCWYEKIRNRWDCHLIMDIRFTACSS